MKKNRAWLMAASLLVICMAAIAGVSVFGRPPKGADVVSVSGGPLKGITPSGIAAPTETTKMSETTGPAGALGILGAGPSDTQAPMVGTLPTDAPAQGPGGGGLAASTVSPAPIPAAPLSPGSDGQGAGAVSPGPIPVAPLSSASGGQVATDIPLTAIEDKPGPPELPVKENQGTGPRERPADPVLTNPDVKPDSAPIPAEPLPPQDEGPKPGVPGSNGKVYVPGFGWVDGGGGGANYEDSALDPEHADFDKIIGY